VDGQNRLTACSYGGNSNSFVYGSDGLRRQSTVNGLVTNYVLDGSHVVREIRNGVNAATYLTGPRGPEYHRDASEVVKLRFGPEPASGRHGAGS
jgi:hypothetical protein